jgi:hypothetical protein
MSLIIARLLIDFGLVILIWMIQLIVYPSFKYCSKEELQKWHKIYTFRIACLVIPLMFGQLSIYGYQVFKYQSAYHILGMAIVVLLWVITFWKFVPLHNSISNHTHSTETLTNLVQKNWDRTGLWTVLFILSIIDLMS